MVVSDVNIDNVTKVAEEIKAQGGKAMALHTDVTSEADVKDLVDTAVRQHGRLDIMVANAGIANIKMSTANA